MRLSRFLLISAHERFASLTERFADVVERFQLHEPMLTNCTTGTANSSYTMKTGKHLVTVIPLIATRALNVSNLCCYSTESYTRETRHSNQDVSWI